MIEILKYERVTNNSKIIGKGDIRVTINEVTWILRRINHFCNGEKKWFSFSNFKDESEEEVKYLPYAEMALKMHNNQLLEALHEPVNKYCLENKIADIKPLDFSNTKNDLEALPF